MQNPPSSVSAADQVDLVQIFGALRRYLPVILLVPLVVALLGYVLSSRQAKVYEASASVIAVDTNAQNSLINNTLVTAPPLPQGAVDQVLHSRSLVTDIVARLGKSGLDAATVSKISADLTRELEANVFNRLKVRARLDTQQRGVYEIRAQGSSPQAASDLAQAGVDALLAWDNDRAKQGVVRSRSSLQQQLQNLTARIGSTTDALEKQSLIAARGQLLQNLSQVTVLETAATGTLIPVAEPVAPRAPVSPRPLRNAALLGLVTLFLTVGAALIADSLRRRVEGPEDLLPMGLPVLAQLPLLRKRQLAGGFLAASHGGALYESVGFLRINIQSMLKDGEHRRLAISSSYPGEGKSSMTAALAESLGATGLKVLVIDADLRRPTQLKVWAPQRLGTHPLLGTDESLAPAVTVTEMFTRPDAAHATNVAPNVDLLPAGTPQRGDSDASILNQPAFSAHLAQWAQGYDFVLIDTPPMLLLPDTLAVAPYTDGVIMVVENGKTRTADVQRSLQNARAAGVPVLGVVLNKVSRRRDAYYRYGGYAYSDQGSAPILGPATEPVSSTR
ncbi:chromosome partitioning protein [Deinococcus sp. KSM4-11]|uniref:polysaccharide biosynthesis tyrosine autokinase n=1 Tax=Deinococcus sp. KSM4-11 TaxID=2568654 RepID=UPI0010A35772|nr:polysaccharide biosynthesis tyrosine autokinase [Deinococcus sp. KSM4-11]THF87133.1 chromosome partitioning protein [Deinococcus sp. KSM4-11]